MREVGRQVMIFVSSNLFHLYLIFASLHHPRRRIICDVIIIRLGAGVAVEHVLLCGNRSQLVLVPLARFDTILNTVARYMSRMPESKDWLRWYGATCDRRRTRWSITAALHQTRQEQVKAGRAPVGGRTRKLGRCNSSRNTWA